MLGFFGDIVFETNDKRILTFTGFKRNSSIRSATHDVIGKKPVSEFLGPNLDMITFTVNLNGNFGVDAKTEMDRWLIKNRTGQAEVLVVGENVLGMDKWKVKSVSQAWNVVFKDGKLFSGSVDIELEEYMEVLRW